MLNKLQNMWVWSARLKGLLAALLFAGSGAVMAANVTFDLCATAGATTVTDVPSSTTVYGYALGVCPATVTAPGGPVLIVNVDDVVTVNLHNDLSTPSGLLFQGQSMVPDTTGVASGLPKSYTFTATNPGTYLYEAALLPNAQHQVAMGLYGALVVRPVTASQAYDDVQTAFTDEAVLVLSELDPALNSSPDPATFDMRTFSPKFFLINGKAYPATAGISAVGNKLLLRYVNAGVKHHSMAVLGLRQNFVAKDGGLLPMLSHNVAAETLAPGQTGDAMVTVPTVTTASKFAVYDASLMLHNNGADGFGGMLTFVAAGSGTAASGPTASGVALTPNPTNGTTAVTLRATISSTGTSAEYFIDVPGVGGSGTAMIGTAPATASLSAATLALLSSGNHTIYVHGTDGTTWGGFASATLNLDKAGPATTSLVLSPNPSSGLVSVALSATANDSATGGANIIAAQYTIDGGAAVPMILGGSAAPVRSLTATIASGLAPGPHTVAVRSQDAFGNWGGFTNITLTVVVTPPVTSGVSASKNPNNGTVPLSATQPVVRITATMTSAGSTVSAAEGFLCATPAINCAVGAPGTGFPFVPSDGTWDGAIETGYADIPLATVNALLSGSHTIYVRGRDAAGNWGLTSTTLLLIDRTAPTITAITPAIGTVAFGTASTTLTLTAADSGGAGLAGGQYWIDGTSTPSATATAFTGLSAVINTSTLAGGTHTVRVRVLDAAGNWSAVSTATLNVVRASNDTYTTTIANNTAGNNRTQSITVSRASGVLTNDQPTGVAGLTATPTQPVVTKISGGADGTMAVTLNSNGSFTYNLTVRQSVIGAPSIRAAKRGAYTFNYFETLNAVTSTATVTITVN